MDGNPIDPITVRDLEERDVFGVFSAMAHPKIYSNIYWLEVCKEFSYAREWVSEGLKGRGEGISFYYTILERQTSHYVGSVNFHRKNDSTYEVGYWIMPEYQGLGYASDALAKCIARVREEVDPKEIVATVSSAGIASKRVLQKNGFVVDGQTQVVSPDGAARTSDLFTLKLSPKI